MKLFFDKITSKVSEDINGRVMIIETDGPVYIEELKAKMLLHSQDDNDFGYTDRPFLTRAPEDYTL